MHFAPLPDGLGRPTRPLMDRPALSGDEVVVGLGAVCDLERVPRVGDPAILRSASTSLSSWTWMMGDA
ncbi:hypothetical protein BCY76_006595 [Nesterenkonia sp. PF2B19]|nr:hypothetical protein BCY76_006595 [Nesterenkonia sp. PF2B19]